MGEELTDVEVIDAISLGWGLLKIAPGGNLHFEQTRVNDESRRRLLSPPTRARGVSPKNCAELDVTYRDYKKFQRIHIRRTGSCSYREQSTLTKKSAIQLDRSLHLRE